MSTAICGTVGACQGPKARIDTVVRVAEGDRYVGDILLDAEGRVWRHADTIPADVVLKTLVAIRRRSEGCGRLVGRCDGRVYLWYVVGALADEGARRAG